MSQRLIATLSISGELIVSRYVAESITTDAGRFGYVGLCQLPTKKNLLRACGQQLGFVFIHQCSHTVAHCTIGAASHVRWCSVAVYVGDCIIISNQFTSIQSRGLVPFVYTDIAVYCSSVYLYIVLWYIYSQHYDNSTVQVKIQQLLQQQCVFTVCIHIRIYFYGSKQISIPPLFVH